MEPDETAPDRPQSPRAAPGATPNDAELSRMARDVIHQPADPRLDRELARMGLAEDSRPAQPASPSTASGSELKRVEARLRRVELILGAVIVAFGILAVIAVVLLLR